MCQTTSPAFRGYVEALTRRRPVSNDVAGGPLRPLFEREAGLVVYLPTLGKRGVPMSSGKKGAQNAVYLVVADADFRPTAPWHIPRVVLSAEMLTKNLPWDRAASFVRVFNKAQLERGLPDRKWAVAVGHAKYRRRPEVPDQAAKIRRPSADLTHQLEEKGGEQ